MGFLREIVGEVRRDLRRPDYLEGARGPAPRSGRSLRASLVAARARGAVVAEFKRVSPGAPEPRLPPRSPAEFVERTATAQPEGLSCVATGPRFGGSVRDVAEVAAASGAPVLFKDFVIDALQLDAARRAGARAVLLIARLETEGLLGTRLAHLADEARSLGLEVLLELHDGAELSRVASVGPEMWGVNVRDLDTLRMERAVAEKTLRAAQRLRPLLGLSGVHTPEDARWFWERGVDGILVGTSVAHASDPAALLRAIRSARVSAG
jgi:indole-3-glycerol phosphate synthase